MTEQADAEKLACFLICFAGAAALLGLGAAVWATVSKSRKS